MNLDISILHLVLHASFVVQIVMLLLLAGKRGQDGAKKS